MKLSTKIAALFAPLALAASMTASADTVVLTFEGVGNTAAVNEFYNGGTDSLGNTGTNYGISFSNTSLGIIDSDAPGGSGNFGNEPSASTILFFLDGSAATMNVAAGFDTGFSFFYSSSETGFVKVYSGLNGTGDLLATLNLSANLGSCIGDPNGTYCEWDPIGVSFDGVARSVDFGGSANYIGFDNITLGAAVPIGEVPEPASLALFGLGALAFGARRRKK